MKNLVVSAERGGPGKSVHTGGRPAAWSWRTGLIMLGLLVLGCVTGVVVLHHTLHLTGWPMEAADARWGAAVAAALTTELWLPIFAPRPRYVPVDLDGPADPTAR
ncbi:hypothetical protein ACFVVA_37075 [Kitasatospora sp. NPDC058048]|uniref:hypothetical protein n=1 Tax=Kitasatospora sp. NPDC058048 TaxID=3346313 RepID=UPI0036D7C151